MAVFSEDTHKGDLTLKVKNDLKGNRWQAKAIFTLFLNTLDAFFDIEGTCLMIKPGVVVHLRSLPL